MYGHPKPFLSQVNDKCGTAAVIFPDFPPGHRDYSRLPRDQTILSFLADFAKEVLFWPQACGWMGESEAT